MRIVSFFTPEYEGEVADFEKAVRRSRCEFDVWVRPVDSRGSWRKNCGLKPHFILGCLEQFDEPVIWIDIDGRVKGKLELMDHLVECEIDFAAWHIPVERTRQSDRPGGTHGAIASGTMFFNNTELSRELLNRWIHNDHGQHYAEQFVLGETFHFDQPEEMAWVTLPQAYCKVFDVPWFGDESGPVQIEHYQASRRLRKVIGKAKRKAET